MKRIHSCALAAAAALVCGAVSASWSYNPDDGTLTDGVWTLNATRVKNTTDQLDVSGQKGSFKGTEPSPIDLAEIYDLSNNRYYAVSFACFNSYSGAWNEAKKIGSKLNPHKDMLTQFIAPDCHKISESGCFMNCTVLTTVRLNETVTSFANHRPFQGCTALVSFYPRTLNVDKIPTQCFASCSNLEGEFNFPDCIGNNGGGQWFNGCSKIESVKMPLITMIPGASFSGCSSLTNVVFSESLDTIQTSAFSGCSNLTGNIIRPLLHPGLKNLGTPSDVKFIFQNCASFDGELEWNLPLLGTVFDNKGNLVCSNVVGQSLFEGCTNLTKVTFVTDVLEIRGSAFKNLAPAAEMHMQASVPVVAAQALGNTAGPFPRVYLKDNIEGWFDELETNYHVMRKAYFNDANWADRVDNTYTRTRANMVKRMTEDTLMCSQDETTGDVTVSQNNVLAFCLLRKSGANFLKNYACFWVLKESTPGFSIIVR